MSSSGRFRLLDELWIHATLGLWLGASGTAALRLVDTPAASQMVRWDIAIIVAGALVTSLALRVLRAPLWLYLSMISATQIVVVTAVVYRERSGWMPSPGTWAALTADIADAVDIFSTAVPPVDYVAPWPIVIVGSFALTVIVTLVLGLYATGRAEALLPASLWTVILCIMSRTEWFAFAAVLVALAVVVVASLRRYHTTERHLVGATGAPRRDRWYVPIFALTTTVTTAGAVALVGVAVGPRLPGADAEAIVDLRAETGGVTQVASPLVDIRSRLVERADEEMFTMSAPIPSYWRLTALPDFDGSTFRLPTADLVTVDQLTGPITPGGLPFEQRLRIAALGGRLVPAAADPVDVAANGLRWSPASDTLVDIGDELASGDEFTIVSEPPSVEPTRLAAAASESPPAGADVRALPADLDPLVGDLARAVAGSARSGYEAALALQDWFRSEFTYDLEIAIGHDNAAIVDFLEIRRGYCEQFAATFAVMARSLGLPARVAVGYTPGVAIVDDAGDTVYRVEGRHAHAWPEVWFDEIGWVPFEPTPGRGAPGAEVFTGVAAEQDGDTVSSPPPAVTTVPESGDSQAADDFTIPVPEQIPTQTSPPGSRAPVATTYGWWILILAAVAVTIASPALIRRIRRWHLARLPIQRQVVHAWASAVAGLRRRGFAIDPWMTSNQIVVEASRRLPSARRALVALADAHDLVMFGPRDRVDGLLIGPYGASLGRDALSWSRQIRAVANDGRPIVRYVVDYLTID